jgi:hypothetical protein
MSESLAIIQRPLYEPISLNDARLQLGLGPIEFSTRESEAIYANKLRPFISAARYACEAHTRRAFITQAWVARLDTFPGHELRYEWNGYPQINIPNPPFQSVISLQYIDVAGNLQVLTQDTTYGTNPLNPEYGYQLERGSDSEPARVLPPFARPWPPTRMVPSNVMLKFRCGFGGPITVSIAADSALLTVNGGYPTSFNFDDAPLLPTETGLPISIPGAGPAVNEVPQTLDTFIASVNPANGQATLATAATTSVSNVQAWAGLRVPEDIVTAIKFTVEHFYDKGCDGEDNLPSLAKGLLRPWRNFVS